MYNSQVASSYNKNDIEKGRQDANQSNAGTVFEHETRTAVVNYESASIGWFVVSILLELVALILSFAGGTVNFIGIFVGIFFLFLSIQGFIGSIQNTKNNVMVGCGGFVLKAILNLIGLIIIAISWESILNQMDVDYDNASLNFSRSIFIITGIAIILSYSLGAVVVLQFYREIEAGVFVPASAEFQEGDNADISVPFE